MGDFLTMDNNNANDNYYDNEIQRLLKELTESLNTDADADPNASNSNTSNTSEHDMSTWEPSFEKRKRKRDQEFERNWNITKYKIMHNERRRLAAEKRELEQRQEERQAMVEQTIHEEYQKALQDHKRDEEREKRHVEEVNNIRYTLYELLRYKAWRMSEEPVPDRPGYTEVTIWHEDFDWDVKKWGPRPDRDPKYYKHKPESI